MTALQSQLHHKIDVLVFNPPYVPTPSEEIGEKTLLSCFVCVKFACCSLCFSSTGSSMTTLLTVIAVSSVTGDGIEVSWAGGEDGREVIDLFLPLIEVSELIRD